MKTPTRTFLSLILFLVLISGAVALLPPRPLIFVWDYPTNSVDSLTSFHLYSQTNVSVPLNQWPLFASYPLENWYSNGTCLAAVEGTNYVFRVTNTFTAGQRWFYVTASNLWGQSDPSNTLGLPPAPTQGESLRVERGWKD